MSLVPDYDLSDDESESNEKIDYQKNYSSEKSSSETEPEKYLKFNI